MRVAVLIVALLLAACAKPPPRESMDQIAEAFVRMSLEIGTHEEGYVDAYYGPPEWKTEAEAHPRSTADLKKEADRLSAELAEWAPRLQGVDARREKALAANVRAARFRLDMIDGARVPFQDEAERLFALRPELKPLTDYDAAVAHIDALVPGRGALGDRVEAFRSRYTIPHDKLQAVFSAAIAECRRRTLAHIALPQNEAFRLEFVTHKPWSGYNYFQGNAQSLIQVNTDLPIFADRALTLGCHEGYPGHHVQAIYAERLYRERHWVEYSILPLFSPQGPLNEGGGNFGVDLAFPGAEKLAFEQSTIFPLAGLNPATAPAYEDLLAALRGLAGARLTIAQMYLDGHIDRARAVELTQHYGLVSRERAEQTIDFTEHYRSYVINYATGEDLVRAYATRAGDNDAQWRAYQRMIAEPTLPEDLK